MIILKILGLILWLLIIPAAMGLVPIHYSKTINKNIGNALLAGYVMTMALTELVGIPVERLCYWNGYWVFLGILGAAFLILAIMGLKLESSSLLAGLRIGISHIRKFGCHDRYQEGLSTEGRPATRFEDSAMKKGEKLKKKREKWSIESKIYLILILALIIFQLVMLFVKSSMDADDCYFNAQALSSQISGTLYRIDAYTGRTAPMDTRHAMALFPIWEAFVSTLSGVHVTILNHRVLPLVLIPLSYLLVYKIGSLLFKEKMESRLLFLLLMNVWRIFGFASYQTSETFFLLRTWQGKSVVGNLLLPMVIYAFLYMYENREESSLVLRLMLALMVLASGAGSSLAVMLMCGLIVLLALLYFLFNRNGKEFFKNLLTIIPGAVYILLYIIAL